VGYFDYGVWLIAPIEDLYSIAPLGQLIPPSAILSISPASDEKKVSTVGYFDYGVWLIAPIEDLYGIAPSGQLIPG